MVVFESKIRKVGTSLGILIPKEISQAEHWKEGQKVKFAPIKEDSAWVKELFGSAKGAKPFKREHRDRPL